jgi:peptide/nickel transport system substrate-binding protein
MDVRVVPIEFRALVERVFESFDYDASVLGLGGADADPNGEMNVWMSSGSNHLWHMGQTSPATPWEAEIDRLMQQQLVTLDARERKRLYDRVQTIVAENEPFIFLATPNVLVGARGDLANFQPSVLDHYTLWNVEQLYFKAPDTSGRR